MFIDFIGEGCSMLFCIKYGSNKKGITTANECLKNYGSAILINGECRMVFTSPIVALRVANYLGNANTNINYRVKRLSKDDAKRTSEYPVIRTFEEYMHISRENASKMMAEIEEMNK